MTHFAKVLPTFWQRRTLGFWLATGVVIATLPMVILTVAGYILYFDKIAEPLRQVASQEVQILEPLQAVQIELWNVSSEMNKFVADAQSKRMSQFYNDVTVIDNSFRKLGLAFAHNGMPITNIRDLRGEWSTAYESAPFIFWNRDAIGTRDFDTSVRAFQNSVHKIANLLSEIHDKLRIQTERTHLAALRALEHSKGMVLIAFALFAMLILLSFEVLDKSLVTSMKKLTQGALRIAGGDHDHRVDVVLPRELANISEAFNFMTTQIVAQEEELKRLATTDGLTGLLNRRQFDKILGEEIQRAERYHSFVSLIIFDIDHFKNFNDTFGHQGGDEALRVVANVMRKTLRAVDKAFRYGGEEFAVIVTESDLQAAKRTAERIRTAVSAQEICVRGDAMAHVTISLGVATFPACADNSEDLIKVADGACYAAKNAGRNRVVAAESHAVPKRALIG